jgi:hypothetical protein
VRSPRVFSLAVSLCLIYATLLRAQEAEKLRSMDVFGVAPGSISELERCFGAAARDYAAATAVPGNGQRARELQARLEQQIKEAGRFEAVEVTVVHYFEANVTSDLTFNIQPAGRRSSIEYLPAPKDDVPDPDGLLASWREYERLGSALDIAGQLASNPPCPAHHCIYGFDHPELQAYGKKFAQRVPADRDELIRVLRMDKDDKKRYPAAYLLAHLPNAKDVLDVLLPQLFDPAPSVRNSVMRVLALMAERGEAKSLRLEPILPFLASTVLTDRNKAVSIVAALAGEKKNHYLLLHRSGCDLLRLLETKQPNETGWAHRALVKLRGRDLGAFEPVAWKKWLKSQGVSCRAEQEIRKGQLCP